MKEIEDFGGVIYGHFTNAQLKVEIARAELARILLGYIKDEVDKKALDMAIARVGSIAAQRITAQEHHATQSILDLSSENAKNAADWLADSADLKMVREFVRRYLPNA